MKLPFFKYQGTGNDFVLIDNRHLDFPKNDAELIESLCDRKLGVGADGLILIEEAAEVDFKMVYYNADGNESTMCGNGGRCIVQFAKYLNIITDKATFTAVDGVHKAHFVNDEIALGMIAVSEVTENATGVFLNTGSPHHVQLVDDVTSYDVFGQGMAIRNKVYGSEGANVNFVSKIADDTFYVRTYERGVEDETLSCGTGVTAVAIAMTHLKKTKAEVITLLTLGGVLKVSFTKEANIYKNIVLQGPAIQVYKGAIDI